MTSRPAWRLQRASARSAAVQGIGDHGKAVAERALPWEA